MYVKSVFTKDFKFLLQLESLQLSRKNHTKTLTHQLTQNHVIIF